MWVCEGVCCIDGGVCVNHWGPHRHRLDRRPQPLGHVLCVGVLASDDSETVFLVRLLFPHPLRAFGSLCIEGVSHSTCSFSYSHRSGSDESFSLYFLVSKNRQAVESGVALGRYARTQAALLPRNDGLPGP